MSMEVTLGGELVTIESDLKNHQRTRSADVLEHVNRLLGFVSNPVTDSDCFCDGFLETPPLLEAAFRAKRIIARPCYDHMLPVIEANVLDGVCVTVYWDKGQATLFSRNNDLITSFDLQNCCTINGDTDGRLAEFFFLEDVFIIHVPAPGFLRGGDRPGTKNILIILSFGHGLVSFWNTKLDGKPNLWLTMPVFEYDENIDNKSNLFYGNEKEDDQIKKLYECFGGSIRFFVEDPQGPWDELRAKILDVAARGCDIAIHTTTHRGTIVHVSTDFDKHRPLFPDPRHNEFQSTGFILGSAEITSEFSRSLASKWRDQLRET